MNKKILSLLLMIVVFVGSVLPVSATEKKFYYISAYTTADNTCFELPILKAEGEAYLSVENAARLSGMAYEGTSSKPVFKKGYHKIEYKGKHVSFEGETYYRMQDLMDALSTIYHYSEETQTFCFFACESFLTNLYVDCSNIFRSVERNYSMDYIANMWGVELAVICDILKNGSIDVIWGGYQRELYEKAISGILLPSEDESSGIKAASKVNNVMKDLSVAYEFDKGVFKKGEGIAKELGANLTETMESYDKLNKLIPNLGIDDCLDMVEILYQAQYASQLYVNAVNYGLYKNEAISDGNLKSATKTVYMHYDNNQPQTVDMLNEVAMTMAENAMADLWEAAIEESFGVKNLYLKALNIVLDDFLGLDKPITATVQSLVSNEIQKEARKQFSKCINTTTATPKNPLQMKYSTILYLRAAQYAYSLYAFDEWGKSINDQWSENIQNEINRLATYSDEELTREVNNGKISFKWNGFHETKNSDGTNDVTQEQENNPTTSSESSDSSTNSTPNKPQNSTTNNTPEVPNSSAGTETPPVISKFGMVDIIGKTYEEADKILKENGYEFHGDKGADGEYHLPDEIQIWENDKWIAWGLNEFIPGVVTDISNINANAGYCDFPITKELNSRVTIKQAKQILEKVGYSIEIHEGTEEVRILEGDNIVWKSIPVCQIRVSNEEWGFRLYWGGQELRDMDSLIVENYKLYEDDKPKVGIWLNEATRFY